MRSLATCAVIIKCFADLKRKVTLLSVENVQNRDFIQNSLPSLHLPVFFTPPEAFILETLNVWVNYGRGVRFSYFEWLREMFPYHEGYFHPLSKTLKRLQSLEPLAFHMEYLNFILGA